MKLVSSKPIMCRRGPGPVRLTVVMSVEICDDCVDLPMGGMQGAGYYARGGKLSDHLRFFFFR